MATTKSMGQIRGEAALEVFRRVMAREKDKSVMEIFAIAAKEPAPQFFVNFPQAYRTVSALARHGYRPQNEHKAAMYDELYRRWKLRGVEHFAGLEEIINEPAPSFYMSDEAFKALVYKMIKDGKRKDKREGRGARRDGERA